MTQKIKFSSMIKLLEYKKRKGEIHFMGQYFTKMINFKQGCASRYHSSIENRIAKRYG